MRLWPLFAFVLAVMTMSTGSASAQVFYASYDQTADAVVNEQSVTGELLPEAGLTDESLRGGGLAVPTTGGVSYPAAGFPLECGCLQMWVRADFEGTDDVRRWFFCDSNMRFKLFKYYNGNLYFQLRTDEGGFHADVPIAWMPGEWYHIACTWEHINSGQDDGTIRLYIDGAVEATATGNFPIPSIGNRLFVGCDRDGAEAAEAVIDEVKIYDEPKIKINFPPGLLKAHDPKDYALSQLGASVTASSEILNFKGKDYPATAVIDGKVSGVYWASDFIFGTAQGPQWLEIDLSQPREVGRIGVYMVSRSPTTVLDEFSLRVLDGGTWRMVAEVTGYVDSVGSGPSVERFRQSYGVYWAEFPPVRTQKVRFEVPGTVARLHEIEVLPPAAEVAPLTASLRDAGPVYRFDFGANSSPLAEDCLPVTDTTLYAAGGGYGWRSAERLIATDRGAGYKTTSDLVAGIDPAGGPVEHAFSVDLPDGDYLVGLISGDQAFDVRPFRVEAEGTLVKERVATAGRGAVARLNATVRVADGTLDLTFAGDQAWVVNAVVIGPADELDAVDAALTEIQHQFALGAPELHKGLTEHRAEPPERVAAPTAADLERGFQVFAPSSYTKHVHPHLPPAEGTTIDALGARCTAGEAEPVSFAIHALRPTRGVEVTVTDLTGLGTIPAEAVEVAIIECWPQRSKMARKNEWAVMPELLRSQDYFGELWLAEGTNRQWWLTVNVPESAAAGEYTGTVTVSSGSGAEVELPLTLRVYPFRLQWPRPMAWGIYCYPGRSLYEGATGNQEMIDRLITEDLKDLRAHGLNTFAFDTGAAVDWSADPVAFNFDHITWVMGLARQVGGFDGPFALYMSGAWMPEREDAAQVIQDFIRALEAKRKTEGWPEFLYYPVDEPFGGEKLENAVAPYQACSGVEGVRTYCTVSGEAGERLGPWLDVRCHATSAGTGYWWPDVYEKAMGDGDEYWWYSNCTREYPPVMRFKAGFHHWKSRATGQSYWNYRAPSGSAFCDFDGGPGDHVTSYPGVDGPVRTIQWECHREGIDDAKYAYTLELLLESARGSNDGKVKAAATEATAVLDRIREATHIDLHYYEEKYGDDLAFHYESDWPPAQYDANRRAIADQIVKLLAVGVQQSGEGE